MVFEDLDLKKVMFADLHIHSRFSRACSKDLNLRNIVKWARVKGLNLMGTGDFSHPVWLQELKDNLEDRGKGIYYYKNFPFILSGEISLIYTQERGRRVHLVLLAPSFEIVDKINEYLDTKGRRDYDGRPIFKISCEEFTREMKKISEEIEIIPAHIWTPYFGVFGSKGGFDSLKEAFGLQADKIYAIETGISSDRKMNLSIPDLAKKTIVSFADSHSFWPWRLGREATLFKIFDSYKDLISQIRENKILGTLETDPSYGKYHFDGHASCNFSSSPEKTKQLGGICPKCGKKLTVGVEYRVSELSGKEINENKLEIKVLPLHEILSMYYKKGMATKTVWNIYTPLIEKFENEFTVLLKVSKEDLLDFGLEKDLVDLIMKNREGKISVKPGYDGVYGEAVLE